MSHQFYSSWVTDNNFFYSWHSIFDLFYFEVVFFNSCESSWIFFKTQFAMHIQCELTKYLNSYFQMYKILYKWSHKICYSNFYIKQTVVFRFWQLPTVFYSIMFYVKRHTTLMQKIFRTERHEYLFTSIILWSYFANNYQKYRNYVLYNENFLKFG